MMFLQVRLLELQEFILYMISILSSGFFEIFLDPLSCLICRFLPDFPKIRTRISARVGFSWLTFNTLRGIITSLSNISTKVCWVLASAILVDSRPRLRMCKYIPLSRISVTLSHADLVVVGSARGSDKASSVFVLRWSFRNDAIL